MRTSTKPGSLRKLWQQQKRAAVSDAQRRFLHETVEGVRRIRNLRIAPTRVESFSDAVARLGLTAEALKGQERRFKVLHWVHYLFSCVLVIYASYLFWNVSTIVAVGVAFAAFAMAVQGYLHGFRAYQIQTRTLWRLQDAMRNPDSWLVL